MRNGLFFIGGMIVAAMVDLGLRYAEHRPHPVKQTDAPVVMREPLLSKHESILEEEHRGPVGVLFLGDSLTDFWRDVPSIWHESFDEFQPCNAGVVLDRVQHVRWRIENGELEGIKPRVIVLLIGVNNRLSGDSETMTALGIMDLIRSIRARQPQARVLLLGLFAVHNEFAPDVTQTNQLLRAWVDNRRDVTYLDISSHIPAEDLPDGLHPNPDGYRKWAQAMLPSLRKLYYQPPATQPA